ncbi:MAG: NADH-quinone oxidoreductase subunit N [Proteobacteria bacterium]|nr:MAG: NADH-quinone oxidoreductase subunit N [Pseudomonadota bacterium]
MMPENLGSDLWLTSPLIVLSLGALLILILEVSLGKGWPRGLVCGLILAVAGLLSLYSNPFINAGGTAFNGLLYVDPFSGFMTLLLILGAILALLITIGRLGDQGVDALGEYYSLYLFSLAGAIIFVSAAELITLFLGLEIMSLSLYCLCGSAIRYRRASESALKYFLLGSFSSAFLLYGIALIYGLTGTTFISKISDILAHLDNGLVFFAMGLILVGMIFKIGAVPFHFWAPDVYEGAPTSITAYMACVIKASAFAACLRVLWVAFEQQVVFWSGAIWVMAVFTMFLGNLAALRQRSLKRMLAYSSIAHAGYMMVGFLAMGDELGGGAAMLYYLLAYSFMTMGAFGVVLAVTSRFADSKAADDITRFNGLGYSEPLLGALMALFMLSLAGIPPGFAGLLGKFYLFGAAVKADYVGLAVIGVINSMISCYYYLRVIVAMYFLEPDGEGAFATPINVPMTASLLMCAVGVIYFGIFPSLVHESAAAVIAML